MAPLFFTRPIRAGRERMADLRSIAVDDGSTAANYTERANMKPNRNVHITSGASPRTQDSIITVDGKPVAGITQVVITGVPDDVWRAQIDLMPEGVSVTNFDSTSVVFRTVALICPVCHSLLDYARAREGVAAPLCPHGGGAPTKAELDDTANEAAASGEVISLDNGNVIGVSTDPGNGKDKPDKGK